MAVTNWWTVNDTLMQITSGPFRWDGQTPWAPASGERAVNADPATQGYSWPPNTDTSGAALAARISVLEARLNTEAHGKLTWPAVGLLALGATNKQTVTLKTPMPNTSYSPSAILIGDVIIASLNTSAVTVVDRQRVDVTVKAAIACNITAGAFSVLVFAD
jgi:hypothetical protein